MKERSPTTVRLTRRTLYALACAFITLAGGMFSTAALAAGVHSFDLLAMLFAMGSTLALLLLLVWYITQLRSSALGDDESSARAR